MDIRSFAALKKSSRGRRGVGVPCTRRLYACRGGGDRGICCWLFRVPHPSSVRGGFMPQAVARIAAEALHAVIPRSLLRAKVIRAANVYQQVRFSVSGGVHRTADTGDELSPLNKAGDVPAAATIGVLPLPNRIETFSIFLPHSNKSLPCRSNECFKYPPPSFE